ncbi:hypothetical protein AB4037_33880 [Labrys sp. KB_33_2]|uniref:hypothetical protein n=1 Tax=Labrys sp. KB_33_2 TaxID=3237479 RepID=UPI003F916FA3
MRALIESRIRFGLMAWQRALLASIPTRWRHRFLSSGRLEIAASPPFAAQMVKGSTRQAVSKARLSRRKIASATLLVPSERVLRRTIELPLAALADLDSVLRLDVPISTPFEAEDVLFGHRILFSAPQGKVKVATAIIPKTVVEDLQAQAQVELHAKPGWVDLGEDIVVEVNSQKAARRTAALRLDGLLLLLALTLGVLAYWAGSMRQNQVLSEERIRLTRTLAAIEETAQLRKDIDLGRQRMEFLPGRQNQGSDIARIIAAIAAHLPADAYLSKLAIRDGNFEAEFGGSSPQDTLRQLADDLLAPGYRLSPAGEGTAVVLAGTVKGHGGGGT